MGANGSIVLSTKQTLVEHQPAPGKLYNELTITVNGQKLKVVDKFTYLGSSLSRAVHIDDEVTARIANASVAFGRLPAMSGSEMESSLTPSRKSTWLWYCQAYCMNVRPGQYTSVMQRDLIIST